MSSIYAQYRNRWDWPGFSLFDNPDAPDIDFEVTCAVPIEVELLTAIEKQAHKRGARVETLVNPWLQQKLAGQAGQAATG